MNERVRPGVLTEQVNLLRSLERSRRTFLKEYAELPVDGNMNFLRMRNKSGGGWTHYLWDHSKGVWTQISDDEFELELDRLVAHYMEVRGLGPYAGGSR